MSSMNSSQGVTLVEMMVVLALFGIFLTMALPGFQGLIRDNRLQNTANEVSDIMEYGRMEAATRGSTTTVAIGAGTITVSIGGVALRQMTLPTDLTFRTTANTISFFNSGAASSQITMTVCQGTDALTGYKLMVERSGRVRHFAAGKNESGTTLSSCTP